MLVRCLLVLTLLPCLSPLLAATAPTEYSKLAVASLPDLPSRSWGADPQVLQADKDGRIFVLRRNTFEVYQLTTSGKLVAKGRLGKDAAFEPRGYSARATMSLDGGEWVIYSKPNYIYVFRGSDMKSLESPWEISALVSNGGDLFAALVPAEMNTTAPTMLRLKRLPLLQQWDGNRWTTMAEGPFPGNRPAGVNHAAFMDGLYSVLLAPTLERRLWMADEFAYRLRRFSPSGKLEDELSVEGGKTTWSNRSDKEWAQAEAAAKRGGMAGWSRNSLSAARAETVFRGMAVGRDGAVYLLVETKHGMALDRFQPALLSLDRVLLTGLEASPGLPTMAAGNLGLYIAGWSGRDGIGFIDSETLDAADWKPVDGAVLNGQALIPLNSLKRAPPGPPKVKRMANVTSVQPGGKKPSGLPLDE
jgi:hypothetical protein